MPAVIVNLEADRVFRAHEIGAQIPIVYDPDTGTYHLLQSSGGRSKVANYVWDPATLSWVPQTTPGSTPTSVVATPYKLEVDTVSATVMYIGKAVPGSSASAAVWQIQQITFSGTNNANVSKGYAGGNPGFTNVWNNRASLSYS
jgi:hypothetical protein